MIIVCFGGLLVGASTATSFPRVAQTLRLPTATTSAREPSALPGEAQMMALARAYPEIIRDVMIREGDWAVRIADEWYYWADGRLLPDELRRDADQYVAIRFYNYELGPPAERERVSPELEARLRDRTAAVTSNSDGSLRFNDFLDTLYGVHTLPEAEWTVQSVQFLGKWIRVHPIIVGPLERIEARVRSVMPEDQSVSAFVAGLESIHAYNWRNIAGTLRRSYHSYGVAVDLVPKSYGGRWAYWLWAAESGVDDWWNLDLDERLRVPQPVIDAFEAEGFVWGGKWLFFDNLHFEYRPESIVLAREGSLVDVSPIQRTLSDTDPGPP
ncbi:MAG: M15 family metallopeptidase [Spirochaetia bacterium]